MKAAFTVWNNRIAPLFDVARWIHVVQSDQGRIVGQSRVSFENKMPAHKARQLAEMGVETLVCGAISRSMQSMLSAYGIQLVGFINGDLQVVINAWQCGELNRDALRMPGCRGRGGRNFFDRPCTQNEGVKMEPYQGNGQGRGSGGRQGQGGGGQGLSRQNSGAFNASSTGNLCICPQCGHEEPHQRGVPCMNKACPRCGLAMTRKS